MTEFSYNMNVISSLSDTPNDTEGLTAQQLKEKFDEGGIAVKAYINGTLLPEIEDAVDGKGDMAKSVYDTDNDGIVDHAELADKATTADSATKATQDKNGNDITTEYAKANHTHTPASIGAAAASHTHTSAQITKTNYNVLGLKNVLSGTKTAPTTADIPNSGDIYLVI